MSSSYSYIKYMIGNFHILYENNEEKIGKFYNEVIDIKKIIKDTFIYCLSKNEFTYEETIKLAKQIHTIDNLKIVN